MLHLCLVALLSTTVVAADQSPREKKLEALAKRVRREFGKVTTPKRIREVTKAFLTQASKLFPESEFLRVKNSDFTVEKTSTGEWHVVGRIYVKGGDKKKFLQAKWKFNPDGDFIGGSHGATGL